MQSLKSISLALVKVQLHRPVVVARSFRLDCQRLGMNKGRPDTKVSATVRTSNLKDEDSQTELVPEEPRKAELPQPVSQRRNELEQRKIRKAEYETYLRNLLDQQKTPSDAAVRCVPFVRNAGSSENPKRRRYDSPEVLLQQVSDPMELAKELVKMARQLYTERQKSEIMMQNFLDLEASVMSRSSLAAPCTQTAADAAATATAPSATPSNTAASPATATPTPNSSSPSDEGK